MAVPKSKISKQRRSSRRANWKITNPSSGRCPECGEPKLSHRACKHCGYYDKKQVIAVAQDNK